MIRRKGRKTVLKIRLESRSEERRGGASRQGETGGGEKVS